MTKREEPAPNSEQDALAPNLVELGLQFSRALKARGDKSKAEPMTKAQIDSLYEDE